MRNAPPASPPLRPIEIIGGGLAGLALGFALRREGVPVQVFEAGEYPRHRVCGEFIAGLDSRTVESLGLGPILADALPHRTVAWFIGHSAPRVQRLPHPALGISRHVLDARLADAFVSAGGSLTTNTRLTDLGPAAGRVLAIGRRRGPSPWLGLKLHVRGLRLERDLEVHLGDAAYLGLSAVENGWINVCGLFRRRTSPAAPSAVPAGSRAPAVIPDHAAGAPMSSKPRRGSEDRHHILFEHLEACHLGYMVGRLAESEVDPESFCSVAALQFDRRVPVRDRIELGDACAMIPPFTGNGMAMAFQSAAAALGPLRAYAHGECTWAAAVAATNTAMRKRFRVRLATAGLLHPFLLEAGRQHALALLSRARLLPFRPLYALLH